MPPPRLVLLLLPLLAACADGEAGEAVLRPAAHRSAEPSGEVLAARALLMRASPAVAADAFRRLEAEPYAVRVRVRELDPDGSRGRESRRTIERRPADRDGADGTLLGDVLAQQEGPLALLRHLDPIDILLPADPPYLRQGVDTGYRYRLLPDRTMDGRPVRGAEAARRPGVDEPVRLVRSWVDATTGDAVAVEIYRASSSMLLTEDVRLVVSLSPGVDGALVPAAARIDARVATFAERARHFLVDLDLLPFARKAA